MIRNTLAVIIGLAVGMIFNTGMVLLNTELHPMPDGVDFNDAEGKSAYIAALPSMGWLLIVVAHVGQAFIGGLLAAAIGRSASMVVAMIVGVISMLLGIANLMSMPLPAWVWIEMPLYLLAAWFAARIVLAWRAGKHPGEDSNFRPAD